MSLPELFQRTRQPLNPAPTPSPDAARELPGEGAFIDFFMEDQVVEFWCWAAVAASVSQHYSAASQWTRCRVANAVLGLPHCCANEHSASCNQMASLEDALGRTGNLRPGGVLPVPATPAQLRAQIRDAERVVGCGIRWADGRGHFVVIHGISIDGNGVVWVAVADPRYGPSEYSYNEFVNRYRGNGSWEFSYATEP